MNNVIQLHNNKLPKQSTGKDKLERILDELRAETKLKKDIQIHPQDIRMNSKGLIVSRDKSTLVHHTTDWALGQLSAKTGIPARYMRQCPPELQAVNFNHWLQRFQYDKENPWLLRTHTAGEAGLIRAFLSEKYSPFDDVEIMDILHQYFGESNADIEIKWWYRDDRGFHLRIVFNELTTEVGKLDDGSPDIHKVGLHIENSEVGAKSLRITPLVYRLICSNGLMGWGKNTEMEVFTQRHVYLKPHEMYGRVVEAMGNALKMGDNAIDKLHKAKEIKIEDPLEVIKKLTAKAKYSKELTEKLQGTFMVEPGNTAFHVIQAFTRGCHELSADKRVEVETDANKFLDELIKGA